MSATNHQVLRGDWAVMRCTVLEWLAFSVFHQTFQMEQKSSVDELNELLGALADYQGLVRPSLSAPAAFF